MKEGEIMNELLKLLNVTSEEVQRARENMKEYEKRIAGYQAGKKAAFQKMKEGEKK